jgi:hypothetical protein
MKNHRYIFTSLTRISDLEDVPFDIRPLNRSQWATADYVACTITDPGSNNLLLELPNGRMRGIIGGETIIVALGERFATLEATGSWKEVGDNLNMHVLTGAGLVGKLTSKSVFLPQMMEIKYRGHLYRGEKQLTMGTYVPKTETVPFEIPTVLFVGTSMSAGKTTSARIITHLFKLAGLKVVGAKLTGAGRYKDILAMKDVGADWVMDFVDAGLPSSIVSRSDFMAANSLLLSRIASTHADVAIIEIGASPLEPYNGDLAIESIREQVKCVVLSASDPYAVYGLMKAFDLRPDIVTGVATNTLAGRNMVERLSGVTALNLIDPSTGERLKQILSETTGFDVSKVA